MSDEKKPEKQETPKQDAEIEKAPKVDEPKAEAPKAEAPKVDEPKAEAPKAEAPKKEENKIEKPDNCAVCNKSIKKKRYYYRNGKNFCTKRCWKTTVKKEEKEAEGKPAEPEVKA